MRKSTFIKRFVALFLVVLMSINTFAAVVGDNNGAAFITKAEFDSMKNDFQSQLDRYNSSLDNKIDGAIASYLSGLKLSKTEEQQKLYTKYFSLPLSMTHNGRYNVKTASTSICTHLEIGRREGWRANNISTINPKNFSYLIRKKVSLQELLDGGLISSIDEFGEGFDANEQNFFIGGSDLLEANVKVNINSEGTLNYYVGQIKDGKFFLIGGRKDEEVTLTSTAQQFGNGQYFYDDYVPYAICDWIGPNTWLLNSRYYYFGARSYPDNLDERYVNTRNFKMPTTGSARVMNKNALYSPYNITGVTKVSDVTIGTHIMDAKSTITNWKISPYTLVFAWSGYDFKTKYNMQLCDELAYSGDDNFWIGYKVDDTNNDLIFLECDESENNRHIVHGSWKLLNKYTLLPHSDDEKWETNTYDAILFPIWAPVLGHNNEYIDTDDEISERGSLYAKYININIEDDETILMTTNLAQGLPLCKISKDGDFSVNLTFANHNTTTYSNATDTKIDLPESGLIMFTANNPKTGATEWESDTSSLLDVSIDGGTYNKINLCPYDGTAHTFKISGVSKNDIIFMNFKSSDSTTDWVCHGILKSIDNMVVDG